MEKIVPLQAIVSCTLLALATNRFARAEHFNGWSLSEAEAYGDYFE